MSTTGTNRARTLDRSQRRLAAATAFVLAAPLVAACFLEPDPSGRGTHRQLGFPPCTMIALCGVPCPTCGMTTSWAHLVRGEIGQSLRANAGGTLGGVLAFAAVLWLGASASRGRWLVGSPDGLALAWIAAALAAVTLVDWAVRLWTL